MTPAPDANSVSWAGVAVVVGGAIEIVVVVVAGSEVMGTPVVDGAAVEAD